MVQKEMILSIGPGPVIRELNERQLQGKMFRFGGDQIVLGLSPGVSLRGIGFQAVRINPDGSKRAENNGANVLTFQFHERPQGKTKLIGYCSDDRLLPEFDRVWKEIAIEFEATDATQPSQTKKAAKSKRGANDDTPIKLEKLRAYRLDQLKRTGNIPNRAYACKSIEMTITERTVKVNDSELYTGWYDKQYR